MQKDVARAISTFEDRRKEEARVRWKPSPKWPLRRGAMTDCRQSWWASCVTHEFGTRTTRWAERALSNKWNLSQQPSSVITSSQ
jgi:hypothetical protein